MFDLVNLAMRRAAKNNKGEFRLPHSFLPDDFSREMVELARPFTGVSSQSLEHDMIEVILSGRDDVDVFTTLMSDGETLVQYVMKVPRHGTPLERGW